jgi:hypothetical protein
VYFATGPRLAVRLSAPVAAALLPLAMLALLAAQAKLGRRCLRAPLVLLGAPLAALAGDRGAPGERWARWERWAPDRALVRGLPLLVLAASGVAAATGAARPATTIVGACAGLALTAAWARAIRRGGWAATGALADRLLAVQPLTTMRQVYLLGMYTLLGVSLLAKGPPGVTVVAGAAALHLIVAARWRALWEGAYEIKRGLALVVAVAVPWHVAMLFREGPRFLDEYLYQHILNRAGHGSVDKAWGTFEIYTSQLGYGLWLWAALLPAALGAAVAHARGDTRAGRVRLLAALWAIAAVAVLCLVQTKFHHYILPAIPALALLVAFYLDDLLAGRDHLHPVLAAIGVAIALLVTRDLMHEPDRWIEMFVYRYDRPWPAAEPYSIDPSDGFLALGLVAAAAIALLATRFVRAGVALAGAVGLAICLWAQHAYMPVAAPHWGMRDAIRAYYEQRTVYGEVVTYFGASQLADDWAEVGTEWRIRTFVPTAIQEGQPMTITVRLHAARDERVREHEIALRGRVAAVEGPSVTVALPAAERARLDPWIERGRQAPRERGARQPVRAVDADRLLAWQLYWRGENFWSGDEIWGWLPEMKTAFVRTDNVELLRYLGDRARAPLGRRYFVISGAGQLPALRGVLPTARARDSFAILDTRSNKFSLGAFDL